MNKRDKDSLAEYRYRQTADLRASFERDGLRWFKSHDEIIAAMRQPEYLTSEGYREEVAAKIARATEIGIDVFDKDT